MDHRMDGSSGQGIPPLIVRIAGLPLEVAERFSSDLPSAVRVRDAVADKLEAARAELTQRLYAAVPGADPPLRRLLLAVKRDCHNHRPCQARTRDPEWRALREVVGAPADLVVALECEVAEADVCYRAAFAREAERQRGALVTLLDHPEFRRGLALASPDLYDSVRELRSRPGPRGRRDRRAETALLRYVYRAAAKVSPFSTFATVGLVEIAGPAGQISLSRGPWERRSLVRVKRYLLHRITNLLCRYEPFRMHLRVELNDSLVESDPGRFRFLRPHHWALAPELGLLTYRQDALGTASLGSPLMAAVSARLAEEPRTYAELLSCLSGHLGADGVEAVRKQVGSLLDAGVLQFRLPWPVHELHLERRMLDHLRSLPAEPGMDQLIARLEALVGLQDGFATAPDPLSVVRAMERAAEAVGHEAAALTGIAPGALGTDPPQIFEDVFARPAGAGGRPKGRAIARMPRVAAEEALENAQLLARISVLFDQRQDFLHTLAAAASDLWPGRREVDLLAVLRDAQPLWRDFMRVHAMRWGKRESEIRTWNPRGLARLAELDEWRQRISQRLAGCVSGDAGPRHIDAHALRTLLDEAPSTWTRADGWGAMLMLQPASTDGSFWVVNRFREGTGRFGSRYTAAMDPESRAWDTSSLAARSSVELDGERVELLDVYCVQGDTLNVHAPQTRHLLTMPDDESDIAPTRRMRLADLLVSFAESGGRPVLRNRGGRRFLPVNLGLAFEPFLPIVAKLLCLFGPSELGLVLPRVPPRTQGSVAVLDRTLLGNLVLRRTLWIVPAEEAAAHLADRPDDADFFAAATRARIDWGIPERCFLWEARPHDTLGEVHRPQYLDFTSPMCVPLLREVMATGRTLTIAELLPTPEMCPRDETGLRWATEVILDSTALRVPRGRRSGSRKANWSVRPVAAGVSL